MLLKDQKKTGQQLRIERRKLIDKMHLGLSEKQEARLKVLDDLIEQLPANESPENRKLFEQIRETAKILKLKPDEADTDEGIAVGLIDTMINSARILTKMDHDSKCLLFEKSKEIQEALKDLYQNADVTHVYVTGLRFSGDKIVL